MTLLDEVKQQLGPAGAVLGPSASRVIECLRDLVGLGDEVARPGGGHALV
jgi:hypothetical protein